MPEYVFYRNCVYHRVQAWQQEPEVRCRIARTHQSDQLQKYNMTTLHLNGHRYMPEQPQKVVEYIAAMKRREENKRGRRRSISGRRQSEMQPSTSDATQQRESIDLGSNCTGAAVGTPGKHGDELRKLQRCGTTVRHNPSPSLQHNGRGPRPVPHAHPLGVDGRLPVGDHAALAGDEV